MSPRTNNIQPINFNDKQGQYSHIMAKQKNEPIKLKNNQ